MNSKIILKKKALVPIDLEGQECDGVMIDASIAPVAKGPFSAKMRGGLSISVVKSSYQKSIRRQYLHLANVCGLLWYEVGVMYPPLMSNLINRLIVIAGEDCAANLKFLHWIDQKVSLLRQKKKTGSLNEMDLCLITSVMSQVPKTRITSWLKSVFYDGLNNSKVSSQVESIYPGIVDLKNNFDQLNAFQAYQNALSSKHPLLAVRYALKIHFGEEKDCSIHLVWNHLLKSKNDEHMQLFYRWYTKEKNENRIYLVLAHVYLIQPDSFQMDEIEESQMILYVNEWKHCIFNGNVKIPGWMIDMHTSEGKKKGMNSVDFAVMGSQIENIWMPLYDPNWLKIYYNIKGLDQGCPVVDNLASQGVKGGLHPPLLVIEKKKLPLKKMILVKKIENEEKEMPIESSKSSHDPSIWKILSSEKLSMIQAPMVPRGQLITASYKPYVYLPREDPQWVYKGPFPSKRLSRLILLEKRYRAFQILGSQVIDVELMKDPGNSYWIRYQNLATIEPQKWQTETKYDKMNNISVEIIHRESLGFSQLSKLAKTDIEKVLFDGDHPFYLTFLDATVFGCGDLGEHNCLVVNFLGKSCGKNNDEKGGYGGVTPTCYLIDYDDSTTKTAFKNYYDVYARNCAAQKKLFDSRVPGLKNRILERLALYQQKQSELENCLGYSLSKTINEMKQVYLNI